MTPAKKPVPVLPGQIWADTDPARKGRTVRIASTTSCHAYFEVVTMTDGWLERGVNVIGRTDCVWYDENGLRGYRLVADAKEGS